MAHHSQKFLILVISSFLFLPFFVHADNPAVTQFTASPASISNGYNIALSWTIVNGDSHLLYFNCSQGVTIKTTGGSTFPCNTRLAGSTSASDSLGFIVTNVSGGTKNLVITVYPKNAGTTNDAGAMSQTITVTTSAQPLTDVTISTTSPASGTPFSISWTGVDIGGTNMQFDCATDVTLFAGDPSTTKALPCNTPAFASDQPRTGSVSITAVNTSLFPAGFVAHVLPAIAPGVYDATHSLTVGGSVGGKYVAPDPLVSTFVGGPIVQSNVPFTVTWSVQNATTTNIQYICNSALGLNALAGTTTIPLQCGVPAFSPALAGSSTATLIALNGTGVSQNLSLTLIPKNASGTYALNLARTLPITVLPPGASLASQQATSTPPAVTQTPSTTSIKKHIPFTLALSRGSRGAQVTALQEFLSLDAAIYPEASVTGFYGPATERAVRRFQDRYGIAKKGEIGYGNVGPKTRTKLNQLQTP